MKYIWALTFHIFFSLPTLSQSTNSNVTELQARLKNSRFDTNRIKLLVELSLNYTLKPGELPSDLDSALSLSHQAETMSRALHYTMGIGDSYLATTIALGEKDEKQRGRLYAQKAIVIYAKLKAYRKLVDVYRELSHYCLLSLEELPKKIYFNERALRLVRQINDKESEATILKEQADLHQLVGNYTLSIDELRQALAIYQAIHFTDLVSIYDLLGFVSTKLGDFQEGLKYGLLAAKIVDWDNNKALKNTLMACTVYNRVGLTYFAMGQFNQASSYYEKAFLIAKKSKYNPSIVHLAGNLSTVYISLNQPQKALAILDNVAKKYPPTLDGSRLHLATRFVDVYRELKNYTMAQQYCDKVLQLSKKEGWENIGQIGVYESLIRFFIASGQYRQAANYLTDNEVFCKKNSALTGLATNHLLWFKLDSTQAKYTAAISHYKQAVTLRNYLLNETKSKHIAQLEVQYETQKKDYKLWLKEKNIQVLTNQSQLQQTQLQQAKIVRNSIIAGAVLLAILLGVSYNRYRLKQRSNQLLEAKQTLINQKNEDLQQLLTDKDHLLDEREWMLKEIHHRVKNNLQIITSLLHSQGVYLNDPTALAAIRESQNRVHAMALIHQKLYQSDRLASISMGDYVWEIVDYLINSFDRQDTIQKRIDITQVNLDVVQAVPLGLIINEAVTNSLKYGFPSGRQGNIRIELIILEKQICRVTISDDGIGLSPDFEPSRNRTQGMSLIRGLSKQLGGTLQIEQLNGVQFHLEFSTH